MKILQIIQRSQLRGAEIFACQLATELRKQDVAVDVLFLFGERSDVLPFDLNFIALQGNQSRRFWDLQGYKRLADIIEKGEYDIVQANAGDTLKYAVLSRVLYKWDAILVYRNASKISGFLNGFWHRKLTACFLAHCDFFISVSENCRMDLVAMVARARNRSRTITIGTYAFDDVEPASVEKLPGPVIINIGSFVREKNHSGLIDIFNFYYAKHGSGCLWLVGDGVLRRAIEEKVKGLGLQERVVFFGYRSDVISLLKSSDILVMPSTVEGIPGVILEAMSCRVPVVASRIGGIPEVIIDDVTGYCLPPADTAGFIERVESLLQNGDVRSRIIARANADITARFLMAAVSDQFRTCYQELLNES